MTFDAAQIAKLMYNVLSGNLPEKIDQMHFIKEEESNTWKIFHVEVTQILKSQHHKELTNNRKNYEYFMEIPDKGKHFDF